METVKIGDKLEEKCALELLYSASFSKAPNSTSWGEGMLVADVALSRDETMSIYIHKDALKLLTPNVELTGSALLLSPG